VVATETISSEQFICQYRGLLSGDEPANNTIYVYEFVHKRQTYWYVPCQFTLSLVCYCETAIAVLKFA